MAEESADVTGPCSVLDVGKAEPWLTPGAVDYLDKTLTRQMAGIEFGSGRSTKWYAGKLGRLISIEHEPAWYNIVKVALQDAKVDNVDYRLVPLNHPESEGERERYEPLPDYVALVQVLPDASLDFVVVDGHYRTPCIQASLAKLKPGGLLLVDDVNMWPSRDRLPVPQNWPEAHRSSNGIKQTVIWQKPS